MGAAQHLRARSWARQLQAPGQEHQVGLVGRLRARLHHALQPAQDLHTADI